jgi:hypothetical protein
MIGFAIHRERNYSKQLVKRLRDSISGFRFWYSKVLPGFLYIPVL